MSDTIKLLIPCNPFYVPTAEECKAINNVISKEAVLEIIDKVQFADAGVNFESVRCPFCHAELMEWWKEAMDVAYSNEKGFTKLSVTVPCCGKESSLNDLEYSWPQGFYTAKIVFKLSDNKIVKEQSLLGELRAISGISWRLIIAHY